MEKERGVLFPSLQLFCVHKYSTLGVTVLLQCSNMTIRTINAFLNAGKGGTILLGIADDGEIKGFSLSLQQVLLY